MDIEFHGQVDNENLIHFYSFFLYFINFLAFLLTKNNRTLNFYLDVGMSKLFLKCKFRKKTVKNDWISPGLSLNEAINFFERSLCICHQSWCWHCDINMSHSKTKPTKWPVLCAQSTGTGQPGHLPSSIWVFTVRMKKSWVLGYSFCWFCHVQAQFIIM